MGQKAHPSPWLSAHFFSKLFFWWLKPLFYHGKVRDLKSDDLHDVLPTDVSEQLGGRLEKYWKDEMENARQSDRKPKLVNAIRRAFGWSYFYYAGHMIVLNCLRVLQPLILGLLVEYFQRNSQTTRSEAYAFACSLVLVTFFHGLLKHHIDFSTLEIGMRLRIASSSLIYRKMVKLSNASTNTSIGGQLINLLSNDVARFDPLFMYLHYIWITPLQGTLIAYLIWRKVQLAALVGVLLMTLETIPVQVYVGKITSKLRGKIAVKTDERVRLMNEIINGIHVIKMYTWEKPFEHLVSLARRYEIHEITSMSYLRGVNISSNAFVDRTCLYFTIMAYALQGNIISADKVFSMVQYFTILQNLLVYNYPRAIFNIAEARVSIKRIEKFLMMEEVKIKAPLLSIEDNASLSLKSVTASWTANSIANTLHDITMHIQPKKLHIIIGPVGSGKSSLLQVMLGELRPSAGEMKINGTVSYASQRPWLFPGTIRDNVLFDQPYDEARYHEVTRVCCLERDFEFLPRGDLTHVGDRGTNLSGGQCARVNLARAVYREADIYIFDDPLSAVDTNVCKCLFNDCINGYLKDKTRIFVTHQLQCLRKAETIFLLNNGKLESQGKFADLSKKELQSLNLSADEEQNEILQENDAAEEMQGDGVEKLMEKTMEDRNNLENNVNDSLLSKCSAEEEKEPQETEELIVKGKMEASIFSKYIRSGNSVFILVATFLFFMIAQVVRSGSDYWLAYWTSKEELRLSILLSNSSSQLLDLTSSILANSTMKTPTTEFFTSNAVKNSSMSTAENLLSSTEMMPLTNVTEKLLSNSTLNRTLDSTFHVDDRLASSNYLDVNIALAFYGCILLVCVFTAVTKVLLMYKICMNASKTIHAEMFSCVLRASMSFFNKQTDGQILNRFSKDTGAMDEILPVTMHESIEVFSVILGVFVQVFIIQWWSIIPIIITGLLYWRIRTFYVPTAYGMKRLEGAAKSPVLSYVTSSLEGLAMIRSSRAQTTVIRRFDARQDAHTCAHFLSIAVASAFGLWLDLVSVILVAFVTIGCVLADSTIHAGSVGLAITQILMLCGMLQRGIRQTAETVTQMTSVERILQFTQLEQEESGEGIVEISKPPSDWPSQGKIQFKNFSLRYAEDDDPVLRDVNLVIEPGAKIGIVGRTGAGKSSLISALFRLARSEGEVLIDEVETKSVGLKELRKRIAIIPQEPVLFSASLRDNLDPFHEFEDTRLWAALEDVQLHKAFVPLDHPIECGGRNLSAGQRQLLCLARAIVKKTRILVLDEATANVDPATDALIRETIRAKFQDCTVLTVAHRLESVIESDRILVVDNGEVIEFDHPHSLLKNGNSIFARMARQTGDVMHEHLKEVAEETFKMLNNRISTTDAEDGTNVNGSIPINDIIKSTNDSSEKL